MQAGAKHCADVNGTFSGPEWASQVVDRESTRVDHPDYPLWLRARIDPESAARLLALWRLYGQD